MLYKVVAFEKHAVPGGDWTQAKAGETVGILLEPVEEEMAHGHSKTVCKDCDMVITTCRCMAKDKTIIYSLCPTCTKKLVETHVASSVDKVTAEVRQLDKTFAEISGDLQAGRLSLLDLVGGFTNEDLKRWDKELDSPLHPGRCHVCDCARVYKEQDKTMAICCIESCEMYEVGVFLGGGVQDGPMDGPVERKPYNRGGSTVEGGQW